MPEPILSNLTPAQKRVLDALVSYIARERVSPSFALLGELCGLSSLATVSKHLNALEKKRFITRDRSYRAIVVNPKYLSQEDAYWEARAQGYREGWGECAAQMELASVTAS